MVELPPRVPVITPVSQEAAKTDMGYLVGGAYNMAIDNCQKQIEAHGLKVKP